MNASKSALVGIRVLDLSRVLAGPWATQILGDLGADVIKIERPGSGDDTRAWGPPFLTTPEGQRGDAAYFLAANRNKRSVAIDFAKPQGAALIKRLIPQCQILVENFKTGGLEKYGLDYESARALNPSLVYCSITGFGQSGPYARRPGYDYMIQAMGGLMSLTGEPAGEPMKSAVAVADLFTGMYAVTAILAALRHAERTGEGQHIDVSLLDAQVAMLANLGMNYLVSNETPARLGNAHASIAPYQVFPTSDGHVVLAVGTDEQFRHFCAAARLPLADDPRFTHNDARVLHRTELAAAIGAAMSEHSTAFWIETLEKANVPCGPINTLPQVFADPHVVARGVVETMTRSDGASVRLTANPIRMTATPPTPVRAPPLLGEDTEAVLRQLIGASASDIDAWRAAGVL
jgi:crotonobetainyl-CoA:carnitine CoA-transferase CaiB-like acyl-CoA transferase